MPNSQRFTSARVQFGVRTLLIAILLAAVGLGIYTHFERQRQRVWRAFSAICDKGVDTLHLSSDHVVVDFKNGNVTDDDLLRFIPALATETRNPSFGRIVELRLNGSNVTDEALVQLKRLAPDCTTVR